MEIQIAPASPQYSFVDFGQRNHRTYNERAFSVFYESVL